MANQWNVTLDKKGRLRGKHFDTLFKQGAKAWNAFMAQHPETVVSCCNFDFSRYQNLDEIDFSHFLFPKGVSFAKTNFGEGKVSFENAKFGDGSVSFYDTIFGNGDVFFTGAEFGNSNVSFELAKFGDGKVSFEGTKFGDGKVAFNGTNFGDGKVSFDEATFGSGEVSFNGTNFGDGEISFIATKFGDGNISFNSVNFGNSQVCFIGAEFNDGKVSFSRTHFGNSEVLFWSVKFGNGDVSFNDAIFGNGQVSFAEAVFGNGDVFFTGAMLGSRPVSFQKTKFGEGDINFDRIQCESLDFSDSSFSKSSQADTKITFSMERAHISKSLLLPNLDFRAFNDVSFRGTSIGTLFDIEGSQFGQLPDLTATTINGHFSVDRIHVDTPKNFTEGDATKARRLKELAKKSEDRKTQLDMLASELDAMTATKQIHLGSRVLNRSYKFFSDYGRSISKPFYFLVGIWFISFCSYLSLSEAEKPYQDAFQLSISQSLPFLSLSRTITQTSLTALYGVEEAKTKNEAPRAPLDNNLVEWTGLIQNLLSYICLFFIGLGIRNRFKL